MFQTLRNALFISRNRPFRSIVGFQSIGKLISRKIENNWKMQESSGIKPDRLQVKRLLQ